MSSDSIINFGRNFGATYEQCIMRDLPWCEFIHTVPTNDKIDAFKQWLVVHIIRGREADKQKKMVEFKKRFG